MNAPVTDFSTALPFAFTAKGTTPQFEAVVRRAMVDGIPMRFRPRFNKWKGDHKPSPEIVQRRANLTKFIAENPGLLARDIRACLAYSSLGTFRHDMAMLCKDGKIKQLKAGGPNPRYEVTA